MFPHATLEAITLPLVLVAGALTAVGAWMLLARRWAGRQSGPRRRRTPDPVYAAPAPADNLTWRNSDYWASLPVAANDRRGIMRRDGKQIAVLVAGQEVYSPQPAYVLNRTSGGLRLAVKQDVPVNTILWLRACNAPVTTPSARVSVRWCEEVDGYFEVGCQFQAKLPWSVLLLFG